MLLISDGVSSFNWQHFSFLVAHKIMVHLTIDINLDLMKCRNNDLVSIKDRVVGRNIYIYIIPWCVLGWGEVFDLFQCFPECRTMIQNDFRWYPNMALKTLSYPMSDFFRI